MKLSASLISVLAAPTVAFHAGLIAPKQRSALFSSVSTTGDYFSNLIKGGLPDFSQMQAPKAPTPLVETEDDSGGFVDEAAVIESWEFPFTAEALVDMAKHFYHPDVRFGLADGGECLADDFEFCGAVVGPVGKEGYIQALTGFGLEESFDIVGNIYGFYADPLQPGRVWYFNRSRAKHVAPYLGAEPTDKELEFPPQMNFLDFKEDGKVKQYGFYTIDRRQGNTGGLGGAYGYMHGVGRAPPFPEARPFKPSLRYRAFNFALKMFSRLKKNKAVDGSVNDGAVNGAVDGFINNRDVNGAVDGSVNDGAVNGGGNGVVNGSQQ